MSPLTVFRTCPFFLMLLGEIGWLSGQDVADTKIQFLDIQAVDNGFGLEVEFTLTANQFVHRLQMESSYDLETWQKKEIYPGNEGEDWISFLSYPLGSTFYRAGVSFPVINLFQDTVQVANGRQSTQVSFGFSDPAFPFDPPELEVVSSDQTLIPQENIHVIRSTFTSSVQVTPTFDGTGDVPVDIIVTASDGVEAKATLTVNVVQGSGIAPELVQFYEKVLLHKFPGFDYIFSSSSPSLRFSRNGEPGNWFYNKTAETEDKAILGFIYDETGNDPLVYYELFNLTFITDHSGNYEYVELVNNVPQNESGGVFDLDDFILFGAGAAPTVAAFSRMAVGKHIINSAWTFDTSTRFNYTEPGGSPEFGNWKYVMTGETTGRVTLTYDEDNNNPAIYREEVDLVFETLVSGSFTYREYDGPELNNIFQGVFDFSDS